MRILELRALRGPNHYSRYRTMLMLLDIGDLEHTPTDRVPGLTERILKALPGLREHRCSPGHPGGFVERLERGTWGAHVVEHVALELQTMAGPAVGFGKTRETAQRGVYNIAYRYREEEVGLEAGRAAVDIVEDGFDGRAPEVDSIVRRLRALYESTALGPSTRGIVAEATARGIPFIRFESSYLQLGHGARQRRIQATMTDRTSGIGMEIADDKRRTKRILSEAGVPVPTGETVNTFEGALEVAEELGYPVVAKPLMGNHGRGITTDIQAPEGMAEAFEAARRVHPRVIIERFLPGHDFRVLVIDHKFAAAARRDPARVTGDGTRNIRQLVDELNADPKRGEGHERMLTRVVLDVDTDMVLRKQGLTVDAVPQVGQDVVLKSTANLSAGGTARDVTDDVHPQVRAVCERVSRLVGLDVMGIDIVAPTLRQPLQETGGGVVEVNAAPGLRMHLEPTQGKSRNVSAAIVDMLFPPNRPATIPIVAITGTNGKTTTARLVAHILRLHGAHVGIASTTGVEIGDQVVLEGDYSGPAGATAVLTDPTVDHAVLEVARGGILRRGLGYEQADVGVLLNVQGDHLGEGQIQTIEDLARLKAVVIENVRKTGTAILNAEDPHVLPLKATLSSKVTLFAIDPLAQGLREHVEDGGVAITVERGDIVIHGAGGVVPIASVQEVPITLDGKARFNVQNALAATATCHALGIADDTIARGLATFNPTVGQLPGRMNLLEVGKHHVLIDYGHNPSALKALAEVLPQIARGGRIINVANMSGNRRDEDIRAFGAALASMYDEIYLCDPDPRGRESGETVRIMRRSLADAGFPHERAHVMDDEGTAIDAALEGARDGDLVVLQVDNVRRAIGRVRARQARAAGDTRAPDAARPA